MSARRWLRIELRPELEGWPPDEWAASALAALQDLQCLGTEEQGDLVVAWLPEGSDPRAVPPALAADGLRAEVVGTSHVEDPGWVEQFNASLQPIDVGPRLTILPRPGEAAPGRVALVIEPGRAFGTGHHESTRLALVHLQAALRDGDAVLDVGTGSGVLALAAVRLGASRAVGIDNDPEAIEVALENVGREPEAPRVELLTLGDPSLVEGRFDVVLANITSDVLVPLMPALHGKLASGGRLILSGLLHQDRAPIERAVGEAGLRAEWIAEGEWIAACAT